MDSMARNYGTTPAALLGVAPGTWDAVLVNTACRLSGLGAFAERIEEAKARKALLIPTLPIPGGP